MNRIDKYISQLFGTYFLAGLVIFATIFMAMDALSQMLTFENVTPIALLHLYSASLPETLYRMVPVACLMSTVFTLTTLNRSNEMIALFSLGMSLFRMSLPILFWVVLLCFVQLGLSDFVLPNFTRQKNFVFYNEIKKTPHLYSTVKTNKIWYRSKNNIFYIKTLNEKTSKAQGLTLYTFNDDWDLLQMTTAEQVELNKSNWTLKNGSVTLFTQESSFPLTSNFAEKKITMGEDTTDLTQTTAHTSDVLNHHDLGEFIRKNKEAGLDTVRYEVDYHAKFGFAVTALVMSLLGIPFSVGSSRSGGVMKGVSISLGLVAFYWIFYNSSLTLGQYGQIPPVAAAWIPNVVMSAFAFIFIRQLKK